MPTPLDDKQKNLERERKKRDKTQHPDELEPVTVDDLNERTERARRDGRSGE